MATTDTDTNQRGAKSADYGNVPARQAEPNGGDLLAAQGLHSLLARLMVFAEQSEVPPSHQQLMSDYVALRRALGKPVTAPSTNGSHSRLVK
jgi:hypothetical protein